MSYERSKNNFRDSFNKNFMNAFFICVSGAVALFNVPADNRIVFVAFDRHVLHADFYSIMSRKSFMRFVITLCFNCHSQISSLLLQSALENCGEGKN